jgi:spermidine synthase
VLHASAMLETQTIEVVQVANGCEFVLAHHGDDWVVRVGGKTLMNSRMHYSEQALADESLQRAKEARAILVGGLGLGFTLRSVLDRAPKDAKVTVAELVPELVRWNRTHLAELHNDALSDPRCEVVTGDVFALLKRSRAAFDVILLDVDNGPIAMSHAQNQQLYGERGLRECHAALKPHGILTVWSASVSPRFERRLIGAGFTVEVLKVSAYQGSRSKHVLFVGTRTT